MFSILGLGFGVRGFRVYEEFIGHIGGSVKLL